MSWPALLREELSQVRPADARRRPEAAAAGGPEDPYWLLVPQALVIKYAGPRPPDLPALRFLFESLWGQWCLFLTGRIHDDLFDGEQATRPALILASTLLRLESERAFEARFRDDPVFWDHFRRCQESSYRAAAEIDWLQRSPRRPVPQAQALYAQASRIFHVGAVAVCLHWDRSEELEPVGELFDRLAVAGQIVDDLVDVTEDLDRGRYNHAASSLLSATSGRSGDARRRLLRELLVGSGPGGLLEEAGRQLESAREVAAALDLPDVVRLVEDYESSLALFATQLHQRRVELVLGPLRDGGARTGPRDRHPVGSPLPTNEEAP